MTMHEPAPHPQKCTHTQSVCTCSVYVCACFCMPTGTTCTYTHEHLLVNICIWIPKTISRILLHPSLTLFIECGRVSQQELTTTNTAHVTSQLAQGSCFYILRLDLQEGHHVYLAFIWIPANLSPNLLLRQLHFLHLLLSMFIRYTHMTA